MEHPPTVAAPASGRRLRRAGPAITLFAGLATLLAACGGGAAAGPSSGHNNGSSAGSSSGGSSSAGSSPSGTSSGGGTGAVAFAQCMRSHGVTSFPDPSNGRFLISGNVQSSPNFKTAVTACQHLLGPNGISGNRSNNSKLLNFAHCMQTHGVPQFPDPTAAGAIGLPQGVDPNSASFQAAFHKCQSKLPGNLQGQQP